jgi:hypothetical protein
VAVCGLFACFTALYPFCRAFYRVEISYNEGWNIYNAVTVAGHHLLYPVRYGWTTVNYPMLSFVLFAQLHRLTQEYLLTARVVSLLSLLGCGVLLGVAVLRLSRSRTASVLAGLFTVALFCTNADGYVGVDDPQMLSLCVFLAGFVLYLWRRESLPMLAAAAATFVLAGSIKHNPIDFPLAVLVDLLLISRRRAAWFAGCGFAFTVLSVALHLHFGGPYFFSQVLAPRGFSVLKAADLLVTVLGPVLVPFCVAGGMALALWKDCSRRVAAILFAVSLGVGSYFGGGQGVTINAQFSVLLAMCLLLGLLFADLETAAVRWRGVRLVDLVPKMLFAWLLIPMVVWGIWNPVERLRETAAAQRAFDEDVAFLEGRTGPVLCESLLRCYFAGKPYRYDPFNATRLIAFGKLDPREPIAAISARQDAAIELEEPLAGEYRNERFSSGMLDAIQDNYRPALIHPDSIILVPASRTMQVVRVIPASKHAAVQRHRHPRPATILYRH